MVKMNNNGKVISTVVIAPFKIQKSVYAGIGTIISAYSILDGSYVGSLETVKALYKNGIIPQRAKDTNKVASIGFAPKVQKWYGWSHRAMNGFGIGSKVKTGYPGYRPADPKGLVDDMINFWLSKEDVDVVKKDLVKSTINVTDPHKEVMGLGVLLKIENTSKIDGKKLYSEVWEPYPNAWGMGEWEANTLEDAKQMAIDLF